MHEETTNVNGIDYIGPHKWIICLLGNDRRQVKRIQPFFKGEQPEFRKQLSISILALTNTPTKRHTYEYQALAESTRSGVFTNVVRK